MPDNVFYRWMTAGCLVVAGILAVRGNQYWSWMIVAAGLSVSLDAYYSPAPTTKEVPESK